VGFVEAVRVVLTRKYAAFSGRASCAEYWWFQVFFGGLLLVFMCLFSAVDNATREVDVPSSQVDVIAATMILFAIAMSLPQAAPHVRRFHDRNVSGWWFLVLIAVAVLLVIYGISSSMLFISAVVIVIITALPGTEGLNRFGSDPLHPESKAEVFT
jgi:uncharacterized membrane protein YhaH (DUF805 family)